MGIIRDPYVILGFVVIVMFAIIFFTKMPEKDKNKANSKAIDSFKRLIRNLNYREGVIAQMFYVGAQIMCWTFIIQYAGNLSISKATAQNYNILAMGIFLSSRFISTFLMKYVNSKKLLALFGLCAAFTTLGVIFIEGVMGTIFTHCNICFYVTYVPNNLWGGFGRVRRRYLIRSSWSGHGDSWWCTNATPSRTYY